MPSTTGFLVIVVGDVLGLIAIPSVLLRRAGQPVTALSWILALIALPYIGVVAWWILGRTHVERQTRKRRNAVELFCESCAPVSENSVLKARLHDVVPFAVLGARWTEGVFPPAFADEVNVLCDGEAAFEAMEAQIDSAQTEIRALFFIWRADETGRRIASQLAQKARNGTKVRILVDAIGGRPLLAVCASELRAAGVEVASSMPLRFLRWAPTLNFRNHRKLLLVDGQIAFVGGMNIGDEYARDWHDLAFSIRGPVVNSLDEVFREDWFVATGDNIVSAPPVICDAEVTHRATATVIASGPERDENRVHDAFFLAITHARQRLWIATPYFIPSEPIMAALRAAAQRGVDVRIVVPKTSDVPIVGWASRSFFPEALKAGVLVFEYQPRFSHAKAVVIDDDLAIIGSPNADVRSFKLNFELACVIDSETLNTELADVILADIAQSTELALEEFENRPLIDRLADSAAHLLSPLL